MGKNMTGKNMCCNQHFLADYIFALVWLRLRRGPLGRG